MNNKRIGNLGEGMAENFLNAQGYKIIKTNHYARVGEIDIIAINPEKTQTIFIEVKTRTQSKFGLPCESITRKKLYRMRQAALHFLNTTTEKTPFSWSFDLIAIQLNKKHIQHIKNILDG